MIKKGITLGFREGDPGTKPDSFAKVVRIDPDGSCALWFPDPGIVMDYASGVIQEGIITGDITIEEDGDAHGTAP